MLGTRNVAFPRLNAFGYWMYVMGGIVAVRGRVHEHHVRMRAGSPIRRSRGRSTRQAKAWTSGRR